MLLGIENASFDVITSIVEMAVTWHELDYSERDLIDPGRWLDLVEAHQWVDKTRVLDFFLALQPTRDGTTTDGLALVLPIRPDDMPSDNPVEGERPHAKLS